MNGEVTQASRIVAAARKSMKDGSAYEFTPLPYEGSVVFNFCDRNKSGAPLFRAKDPADWYAHLSKEGVKNIFMIMGMKVNRRSDSQIIPQFLSLYVTMIMSLPALFRTGASTTTRVSGASNTLKLSLRTHQLPTPTSAMRSR